jgi:hypothetical protein
MTSEIQIAYGSVVRRHGKSRALLENHSSKFETMDEISCGCGLTHSSKDEYHSHARLYPLYYSVLRCLPFVKKSL